ncbi:MAG: polysaccharide biosynthesis/export family protein [Chitinophagaceae bacterium]|jgi:polysaccharide export outer membrane protein
MIKLPGYVAIGLLVLSASCSSPKKTIYFNKNSQADTTVELVQGQKRADVVIGPDDIVAINISSVDAFTQKDPVAIFNDGGVPYNISAQSSGSNSATSIKGYLVNPEGDIDFPVVGKIKLAGLTPTQAKEMMSKKLEEFIKAPVVEVRVINYKVNLLGEVSRVGPVLAPNHKINILEALAAAGDIPITGRKDNVLIIREKNGIQEFGRVNLNSKKVFTSPYYYLQKNDIVYVEPNRLKRQQTNEFILFYLPAIATVISSALSIYGIVQLTKN